MIPNEENTGHFHTKNKPDFVEFHRFDVKGHTNLPKQWVKSGTYWFNGLG